MMFRALLMFVAVVALPSIAAAQDKWTTYYNGRFGTSIEYPSRFKAGPPPDNNDGQSFTANDGAKLAVWGSLNALEHDIPALEEFLRDSDKKDEKITYRAAGKNWLVLSGTRGERLFYKRYVLSHRNEVENAFEISYPANLAEAYTPIVSRIAKSLKPGRGYQVKGAP